MPTHTVADWLRAAVEDAERRGLPELKPLLEALARSTTGLRAADADARDESAVLQADREDAR